MRRAAVGSIVAVAKGFYDEDIELAPGVIVWGACVAETVLASTSPISTRGTVNVLTRATMRNITVSGARPGIFVVSPAGNLTLLDVWIRDAQFVGLYALEQAQLTATRVLVTRTRGGTTSQFGRGIVAQSGSQVTLRQVVVSDSGSNGVSVAEAGSTLNAASLLVRGTRSWPHQPKASCALMASVSAKARVVDSLLDTNTGLGACALDHGELVLERSVVRGTEGAPGQVRSGIGALSVGAMLTLNRTALIANGEFGVSAEFGALSMTDVLVMDTKGRADGTNGIAVVALDQGIITARRTTLEGNRTAGVLAYGSGASATFTDLVVRTTMAQAKDNSMGYGLAVGESGRLAVERGELTANTGTGGFVLGVGSQLSLTDLTIRQRRPTAELGEGRGIEVAVGAELVGSRMVLEGTTEAALFLSGRGSRATVSDLVVVGTRARPKDQTWGRAVQVQYEAILQLERARLTNNHEMSMNVFGDGAQLIGRDIEVVNTLPRDCDTAACRAVPLGIGLMIGGRGSTTLQSFRLGRSASIGVLLHSGGRADFAMGEINSNPIGVSVHDSHPDLSQLERWVRYTDNVTKFSADFVPLPDLAGSLGQPAAP